MTRSPGRRMRITCLMAVLTAFTLATRASAQSPSDGSYEIGLRSTVMVSTMRLSELGNGFEDLRSGGKALPHSSSIFVMWSRGAHVRLGVETNVLGNGMHYKESEMFLAPQLSVGRRIRRLDVRLAGRQVLQFGAPGVAAFDSFYAGIGVGLWMR